MASRNRLSSGLAEESRVPSGRIFPSRVFEITRKSASARECSPICRSMVFEKRARIGPQKLQSLAGQLKLEADGFEIGAGPEGRKQRGRQGARKAPAQKRHD